MRALLKNMAVVAIPSLRRLIQQRDEARSALALQQSALVATMASDFQDFVWMLYQKPCKTAPPLEITHGEYVNDSNLVSRVAAAYKSSTGRYKKTNSFWDRSLFDIKHDVHDALSGSDMDLLTKVLRDPAASAFFWGFDAIAKAPLGQLEPHEQVLRFGNQRHSFNELYGHWLIGGLDAVAQSMGARRLPYPETYPEQTGMYDKNSRTVDDLIDQIERSVNTTLLFPNPFPGELGLQSKRGVIGFRSIQAIYQAWRISRLAGGNSNFRVLEIGAGLGRTAFYANLFGIKDYTIIDIPLTNAAQGYFLGRTLGESAVQLEGDIDSAPLKIKADTSMSDLQTPFDLVVNVDSLTEMDRMTAESYWQFAKINSSAILSINHEHNEFTVNDLYRSDETAVALRFPYWPRRGYVEEYVTFTPPPA